MVAVCSLPTLAASFEFGMAGCCDSLVNQWPEAEGPEHVIDGVGQKYLNFGEIDTGFAISPAAGSSVAASMKLWAANDAVERDPNSYQLWGSNESLPAGATSVPLSAFSPISIGDLMLPDSRNAGGDTALDDANSMTVTFDNDAAYTSYLVVFPGVKDAAAANSMQIAEVQLFDAAGAPIFAPGDTIAGGQVVPEPAAGLMGLFAACSFLLARRRR